MSYTRLTSQALYYEGEMQMVNKVLAIEEAEGMKTAAYSLRSLQSEKKLSITTTVKDPVTGKLKPDRRVVRGPVAVLVTTTWASLDEETASRFLTLTIDESRQMTQTIMASQRYRDTMKGYKSRVDRALAIKKHHTAQRLLQPLVVINDLADQLTFPSYGLRARRDHNKYLMLIKAIAFLHQKQRKIEEGKLGDETFRYINVTASDVRRANALIPKVLSHSVDEISAPARNLLKLIHAMVKSHCAKNKIPPSEYRFTRRHIRDATGWSEKQIRNHIDELKELEYVKERAGSWGKEYIYELTLDDSEDDNRFAAGLVDPDTLREVP